MAIKKRKAEAGPRRPGGGRKRVLNSWQRLAVSLRCEERWAKLQEQTEPKHAPKESGEGATLHYERKRPYGARNEILAEVAKWCGGEYGIAVTTRMIDRCWVEYRRELAAAKAAVRLPKAKPARARRRAA